MPFKIHLLGSDIDIRKKLNQAAIKKFSKIFNDPAIIQEIEKVVRLFVRGAIQSTKTWQSLVAGGPEGLDAHFGIPRGSLKLRLDNILNTWSKEIIVKPQPIIFRPRTFSFSYKFYAIYGDWHNVLSLEDGITINVSKNPEFNGKRLPWLQWLLVDGDKVTVEDYHIVFENRPNSRSGKAVMIKKLNWRVPGDFAPFSTNNNFVTRAMDELADNPAFKKQLSSIITSTTFKDFDEDAVVKTIESLLG